MFDRRVNYVLTRFSRHSQPTAPGGRTRGSMTSLYETHRLPLEQSTQSPPPEEEGAEGTRQAGFQGTYQKGGETLGRPTGQLVFNVGGDRYV